MHSPTAFHLRLALAALVLTSPLPALAAGPADTARLYLSGHGPKDAVPWEFTVTGGRRAGEKATIPVPSNWEQHGFGTYNYGDEANGKGLPNADEHGLYARKFTVPAEWRDRRIRLVFDGVMTDATVKVNGRSAGPPHQGAFYRFSYDITPLVKFGEENSLEVDVAKVSANPDTNAGERSADYWVFGGIFRPVWLEAVPAQSIAHAAIDARADGRLTANVDLGFVRTADRVDAQILDADGQPVGAPFSASIPGGGTGAVRLTTRLDSPRLWTAETPHLYTLQLTLRKGGEALHTTTSRFGFRTFEVRLGQGLYLNGKRILLKGVGRHSFRPDTARALDPEDCYADARLIKEMNMNAVRMTHYPPDEAFLEACDELGLYVIDELSGWHHAHDTEVGRRLIREMVTRDVNHPSIMLWDNGNEGGWNRELDAEFARFDPQARVVLHPWELFNGVDTKHYPTFDDLQKRLAGPNLVMPTEMLHALYDGGAGAGLEDYWNAIAGSPFGAGGFVWVFADEGIVRTDQGGRVDVYSTYAPDGMVGPRHEKEGSFFTARDLFSPVRVDSPVLDAKFRGRLTLHNHYDFLPLGSVRFRWQLLRFADPNAAKIAPTVLAQGNAAGPKIAPGASGPLTLDLPANWRTADALSLSATDSAGQELWTWTWPTPALTARLEVASPAPAGAVPTVTMENEAIVLRAGDVSASFDAGTSLLRTFQRGAEAAALANGPRLAFAHPAGKDIPWTPATLDPAAGPDAPVLWRLAAPQLLNIFDVQLDFPKGVNWAGFKLEISPDGETWKTLFDATRRTRDGNSYEFSPQVVAAVRLSNLRRSDGQPATVKALRAAYQADRFPPTPATPAKVTTGSGTDPRTRQPSAWIESTGAAGLDRFRWTLVANGDLRLDYAYTLDGTFNYAGITFDQPEEQVKSLRWLGDGPFRVWRNRLPGTTLSVHEIARNVNQSGETWNYPEFQGYFAGLRWARFDTTSGPLTVTSDQPATYLRVGTPRINYPLTSPSFPAGDLSFLSAIPAMGSKFVSTEKTGPASQPAKISGPTAGTLTFRLGK